MKPSKNARDYAWASNPLKLQRAVLKAMEQVNTAGGELSEELVQEWYVKLGGLVLNTSKKVRKNAEAPTEDSQA